MSDAPLPQPYTTEEIEHRPYAVIISLLIGLLLASVGWNIKNDNAGKQREQELTDRVDAEKNKRIEMYENMLFYKGEKERLETEQGISDSTLKERTAPFVNKLLRRNR